VYSRVPERPNWRLSIAPETPKLVGDSIVDVDVWSEFYDCWVEVQLGYTHILITDHTILLQ
jgi:hypothetical protein